MGCWQKRSLPLVYKKCPYLTYFLVETKVICTACVDRDHDGHLFLVKTIGHLNQDLRRKWRRRCDRCAQTQLQMWLHLTGCCVQLFSLAKLDKIRILKTISQVCIWNLLIILAHCTWVGKCLPKVFHYIIIHYTMFYFLDKNRLHWVQSNYSLITSQNSN